LIRKQQASKQASKQASRREASKKQASKQEEEELSNPPYFGISSYERGAVTWTSLSFSNFFYF
jgi:hypothetical protein